METFTSVASTVLPQCTFITYFNLLTGKNMPITLYTQIYYSCKNVTMLLFSLSFNGMSVLSSRIISNKINWHIKRSRHFQYRHKFKGYLLNAGDYLFCKHSSQIIKVGYIKPISLGTYCKDK